MLRTRILEVLLIVTAHGDADAPVQVLLILGQEGFKGRLLAVVNIHRQLPVAPGRGTAPQTPTEAPDNRR